MDLKQAASQSAEDAQPAGAGFWGCLLFGIVFLVFILYIGVLHGGAN